MANYPYQNPALSIDERVDDLMSRMSTAEKVKQITCAMVIRIAFEIQIFGFKKT